MYCTNCGEKLAEGAVFCGSCGCRVDAGPSVAQGQAPSESQIPSADEGQARRASQMHEAPTYRYQVTQSSAQADGASWQSQVQAGAQVAAVDGSAPQPQPAQAYTAVDGDRSRRSSLAAFLMERRQVGKAMVPTFAIILAMLIAAAGTAYALVKAYEVFVEPAIEQKSASSSGTSAAHGDKKRSAAGKKEDAKAENKKAHAAYGKIVDLYKTYGEYYEEVGIGPRDDNGEELNKRLAKFGDYSYMGIYAYDKSADPDDVSAYYFEKDFDGDGIDELFVADRFSGASDIGLRLVNFYYFNGTEAKSIFDSIGDGMSTTNLSKDGFLIMGEGEEVELCDSGKIALRTRQAGYSATYYFDYKNSKLNVTDALQIGPDNESGDEFSYKVLRMENGKRQPDQTISGWKNAGAMRDDFDAKHPASSENDKLLASNDWTLIG